MQLESGVVHSAPDSIVWMAKVDCGTVGRYFGANKLKHVFLHPLQIITAIVISNYIVTFSIQSIHLVTMIGQLFLI